MSLSTDACKLRILVNEDPVKGPRTLPNINNLEKNKVNLAESAVFSVNLSAKTVSMSSNGISTDIGPQIYYFVNS